LKSFNENVDFSRAALAGQTIDNDRFFASHGAQLFETRPKLFWAVKRMFDIGMSLALLPLLAVIAVVVAVLNPFFNNGSLLFFQLRMGRGCRPFTAVKFRTMREVVKIERGPNDPLETSRITRFGRFMRKSRIDELPQILNVLKGEMSLIGPRPDYYDHAKSYVRTIPSYAQRHQIRPGISGLAQTRLGYIEGTKATRRKVNYDLIYIRNAGFRMELSVFVSTILVVLNRGGQ
jgi:lipopolysaccharide/colanic/teichoic acid biosynthesis glycosyltransferase